MSSETTTSKEEHQSQNKTVFGILSNLKQTSDNTAKSEYISGFKSDSEIDDIAILKKNPDNQLSSINKAAYLKLHRSLSPHRSIVVDRIKEKYEHINNEALPQDEKTNKTNEKRNESIETIKSKYSPASLGYTKSKLPIPKPRSRNSLTKIRGILPSRNKEKKHDGHDNAFKYISSKNLEDGRELTDEEDGEDEFLTIVTRSDSEESVFKIQKELSVFTMDKKKRTNSFRKLFTGKIFGGKEKNKQNSENDTSSNKRAEISSENNQNEYQQFNRQSPYRHTTNGVTKVNNISDSRSERCSNSFNLHDETSNPQFYNHNKRIPQTARPNNMAPHGYVPMDKPIFKSNDPSVYIQITSKPQHQRYHDNSSTASVSTLESEKSHLHQFQSQNKEQAGIYGTNISVQNKIYESRRDTPPRALETRQDLKLVNPKALIPINSERPLPNPYQNVREKSNSLSHASLNSQKNESRSLQYFEEDYGTVFDSIAPLKNNITSRNIKTSINETCSPPSPSLEPSKLKLPPNREIVPLSPRIRSPIPQENVSTDKIIATELLKAKRSPTPTKNPLNNSKPSQRKLDLDLENVSYSNPLDTEFFLHSKPPPGTKVKNTLNDSRYSNESGNLNQISPTTISFKSYGTTSPVYGYQTDFNLSSPSNGGEDHLIFKEEVDNMAVELRNKSKVTMSKTFSHCDSSDIENGGRRFYEVGHINQGKSLTSHQQTQEPTLRGFNQRTSVTSNESLHRLSNDVIYSPSSYRTPTPNKSQSSRQSISMSPIRSSSRRSLSRPSTPLNSTIPESPKTTPQKEEIRKSVEAYYWNEIKKLKDKENYDLYLYQMQFTNVVPQTFIRESERHSRSRNTLPLNSNNTRRSLSLPRERKLMNITVPVENRSSFVSEVRKLPNTQTRTPQQPQNHESFLRNSPQRSTVDGSSRIQSYDGNSLYRPIFKRGSLSTPPKQAFEDQLKRKVSFSKNGQNNSQAWPTRNGFTKSPPQRRLQKVNDYTPQNNSLSDARYDYPPNNLEQYNSQEEAIYSSKGTITNYNQNLQENIYGCGQDNSINPYFLQKINNNATKIEKIYGQKNENNIAMENSYGQRIRYQNMSAENPYGIRVNKNDTNENIYGQRISNRILPNQQNQGILYGNPVNIRRFPQHGSTETHEDIYGHRQGVQILDKKISHQSYVPVRVSSVREPVYGSRCDFPKREIIVRDEIYGQFGRYVPSDDRSISVAQSKENVMNYNARVRDEYLRNLPQKQVTVNNKVCDFYGKIHDVNSSKKLQSNGVLMGQLHRNPASPLMEQRLYLQQPTNSNFIRNSRLTASANDMYRREPNTFKKHNDVSYGTVYATNGQTIVNVAPTRPLPPIPPNKIKSFGRVLQASDTESGSDASEIQRILGNKGKIKKKNIFGK